MSCKRYAPLKRTKYVDVWCGLHKFKKEKYTYDKPCTSYKDTYMEHKKKEVFNVQKVLKVLNEM